MMLVLCEHVSSTGMCKSDYNHESIFVVHYVLFAFSIMLLCGVGEYF